MYPYQNRLRENFMTLRSVELKLELLSHGVAYGPGFLERYAEATQHIEKRRAYGSGDLAIVGKRVPQEAFVGNGIISGLNHSLLSPWALSYDGDTPVVKRGSEVYPVSFPSRPSFYGTALSNGVPWERIGTVYGDKTLGVFTPGHCYYFNDDLQCRFCSLGPARKTVSDHLMVVQPDVATEAVQVAIESDPDRFKHVLINGGNIRNYDHGFTKQVAVHRAIASLDLPGHVERHLISMPPKDHALFEQFAELGGTLAMSMEIFDPELFKVICPGKAANYGQQHFLNAYRAAVDVIGKGNVYAGLVAGLEPLDSLIEAMEYFGEMGAVPAIAVFHPDENSLYADHPRPTVDFLQAAGEALARVYKKYNFRAFITDSGRNAIDTEAYRQAF
jgi:hypothetical protein